MKFTLFLLWLVFLSFFSTNLVAGPYFIASCRSFRKAIKSNNISDIEKFAIFHYLEKQHEVNNNWWNWTKKITPAKKACKELDAWLSETNARNG